MPEVSEMRTGEPSKHSLPPRASSEVGPLSYAAELIKSGKAKNIVFMVGAGISTSAGIPDFRSPGTGLYANLAKLNLPHPEAVFELGFFQRNPQPFWTLAQEIYPGHHFPTPTHYLFSLLHSRQILQSVFTQNIDTLELLSGLPVDKVIDAHGSFATAHCLRCQREASRTYVLRAGVRKGEVVRCSKKGCGGLVKPDIVFFGEGLPERFWKAVPTLKKADLLFVIGTSLQVHPFASMVDQVPITCPRILINREAVGPFSALAPGDSDSEDDLSGPSLQRLIARLSRKDEGLRKGDKVYIGDADEAVWELVKELGWEKELRDLMERGNEELQRKWKEEEGNQLPQDGEGDEAKEEDDLEEDSSGRIESNAAAQRVEPDTRTHEERQEAGQSGTGKTEVISLEKAQEIMRDLQGQKISKEKKEGPVEDAEVEDLMERLTGQLRTG